MKKDKTVLELFLTFLKIGGFTFGGGYAMIPMIQKEIVEKKKWLSANDILDIVAIAETTPGPIAINAATFVGYKTKGIKGAIAATFGIVLPSFVIITIVAMLFDLIKDNQIVQNAFWGIKIGVLALIVKALINMFKQCKKGIFMYAVVLLAFVAVAFCKLDVVVVVVIAALLGLCYQTLSERGDKHDIT